MKKTIHWNGRDQEGVYNSIRRPKNKEEGYMGVVYDLALRGGLFMQINLDTNLVTGEVVNCSEVR